MANPSLPDLLKDSSDPLGSDNEFFLVTIVDLELATTYPIEFAWKRKDGTIAEDWSAAYKVATLSEAAPLSPRFEATDLTNDGASLVVRWGGLDSLGNAYGANFDRVEIFAKGGSFGSSYVNTGYVFREAGTKVISVSTGATYYVKLRAVTKRGTVSLFSTERTATTVQQLVVDVVAPTNPTGVSATAEVDPNDQTGFSLKATISFTKSTDPTCRGYRLRWTTQTVNPVYEYAFVEHPDTGSTVSYTATGLIPNITYYYQVAAVDELNNTQTYTTAGTFIAQDSVATAEGSLARLKSYISIGGATGDQFKFGTGIAESINTSITITPSLSSGTYHGILLNKTGNKNNFWLTTGQLRVGTDTQFMYFNGTNLYLTGDINAASGKFSGNILLSSSNASLYNISSNHTINSNGTLPAGSTGFVLNATGLQFKYAGSETITLNATNGKLVATDAEITGSIQSGSSITGASFKTKSTNAARVEIATSNTITGAGTENEIDNLAKLSIYDVSDQQGAIATVGPNKIGIWAPGAWGGSASMMFYGPNAASPNTSLIQSRGPMQHDYAFPNITNTTASTRYFRNIGMQSGDLTAGTSDPSGTKNGDIILIWE
jgi:hypothetical protein